MAILVLVLANCSDNDNAVSGEPMEQLIAEDFMTTIDEHPIGGEFLGTIEANMEASFAILSQNPSNALSIDIGTGNISISDASAFDYEINQTIEATVQVSSTDEVAQASVVININDLDDIAFRLTDSEQDYLDTDIGNWVLITEDEYNILASSLNEVTKLGTSDGQYDDDIQTEPAINQGLTIINNNSLTIPSGSYVFAFKYHAYVNQTGGAVPPIENAKVKISETDIANGYYDLGFTLPTHENGDRFFVLKGNNTPTSALGYLGVCESDGMGYKRIEGTNVYSNACAASDFFNKEDNAAAGGLVVMYQGLSTTQKQWD